MKMVLNFFIGMFLTSSSSWTVIILQLVLMNSLGDSVESVTSLTYCLSEDALSYSNHAERNRYLATVNSTEIQNSIQALINGMDNPKSVWIGAQRPANVLNFASWDDGTEFNLNVFNGFPDGTLPPATTDPGCLAAAAAQPVVGEWEVAPCDDLYAAIYQVPLDVAQNISLSESNFEFARTFSITRCVDGQGQVVFPSFAYCRSDEGLSYSDHQRNIGLVNDAHLATVDRQGIQNVIEDLISFPTGTQEFVWLGAQRSGDFSDFTRWDDGTKFETSIFSGFPNAGAEPTAIMDPECLAAAAQPVGEWNAASCEENYAAIYQVPLFTAMEIVDGTINIDPFPTAEAGIPCFSLACNPNVFYDPGDTDVRQRGLRGQQGLRRQLRFQSILVTRCLDGDGKVIDIIAD